MQVLQQSRWNQALANLLRQIFTRAKLFPDRQESACIRVWRNKNTCAVTALPCPLQRAAFQQRCEAIRPELSGHLEVHGLASFSKLAFRIGTLQVAPSQADVACRSPGELSSTKSRLSDD